MYSNLHFALRGLFNSSSIVHALTETAGTELCHASHETPVVIYPLPLLWQTHLDCKDEMQCYLTICLVVVLVIYAMSVVPMPISGLSATSEGWGLELGLDNSVSLTSSATVSSGSNETLRYPAYIKGIDTGLTATAILLMAATYYLMIKHATPLGNYCKLPSKVISANLEALLGDLWPLTAKPNYDESEAAPWKHNESRKGLLWTLPCHNSTKDESQPGDRLLYIGWDKVQLLGKPIAQRALLPDISLHPACFKKVHKLL
jgi:hypothetical protein